VITAVQTTGLKIITTVCDQGTSNIKAINTLKEKTNRDHLQNDVENKYFGFTINNEEIIPIFDPCHLLKTIRNN